jgi:hypothetical protein
MFVVVTYPLNKKEKGCREFHIYTKQNSVKEKLVPYYELQKARLEPYGYCVLIIDREVAKIMKNTWNESYFANYGWRLTREARKASRAGHKNHDEEEW